MTAGRLVQLSKLIFALVLGVGKKRLLTLLGYAQPFLLPMSLQYLGEDIQVV